MGRAASLAPPGSTDGIDPVVVRQGRRPVDAGGLPPDVLPPALAPVPGASGARPRRAALRPRRSPLRGRHVRERAPQRAPVPLSVPYVERAEDRLVLHVLRGRAALDLDAAQVGAVAGLAPSAVAPALDRLVRAGLVRTVVVRGRERYGLP